MLKIAFCGVAPHAGGSYTLYKHLRDGLAKHKIDLRWVSLAQYGTKVEDIFQQEESCGELLFYKESKEERREEQGYETVHCQSNEATK